MRKKEEEREGECGKEVIYNCVLYVSHVSCHCVYPGCKPIISVTEDLLGFILAILVFLMDFILECDAFSWIWDITL